MIFRMLFICSSLFLLTSTVVAENWTEFRGPSGQGHSSETGLPVEWSQTKNVVWNVKVPGKGWSSPIYLDGKLYLTTAVAQRGKRQGLGVICLDAKDGKMVWKKRLFKQRPDFIHKKNSHASSTPITDGKRLFVHFGTHGTACLSLSGKVIWKTTKLKYRTRHGNGGSPVLVNDLLVVACDGADVQYVVALDQNNGKIRWKKKRHHTRFKKKFSFGTPLVIQVNGKTQIISPGTSQVTAFDPKKGDEIWTVNYTGFSVIPRPVYANGLVIISTSFMRPVLIAIDPTGKGDVTNSHISWQIKRGAPHTPSALSVEKELYFVSDKGVATCVDTLSGKTHWVKRLGGNYSASPVYADGKIYFQSEQGDTTVIAPGKEYKAIAKSSLGEPTLASYAIADSAIFIRTEGQLYRIEKK
ncbi:probable serine/threonine protein kinase afsK [hydrothermal vent metagenome]|uniref:Probable serine/threonine protein kinase afsK n=1 Tax=hydrothermal vent metagenome TaxID=652676 RepID=A0A3B1DI57_9ZZZZ